ncbi:MAG: MMPL family transporter [Deltaproteobacteria bacterium]|nr:MMPL family transporter [Deltaproteobacteria bacterium]
MPFLRQWQRQIFFLSAVFLLISSIFLGRLRFDKDLENRFLPEDPAWSARQYEKSLFGGGEEVFLLSEWEGTISPRELLRKTDQWKEELSLIPGVSRVISLFDLPPLREEPDKAVTHPFARKNFLKKDGRGTVLVLSLESGLEKSAKGQELLQLLEDWIDRQEGPWRMALAGALPFQARAVREAHREAIFIGGLVFLLLTGLLACFFRSWRGALLVVLAGLLSITATFGLAGLWGTALNQFALIIIPVILAVGLLDHVHLFFGYSLAREEGMLPEEALGRLYAELAVPCFWTSSTTIAGFAALLVSSVSQIRQFGALGMLGTAVAYLVSFGFLPWLLFRFDFRKRPAVSRRLQEFLRPRRPVWVVACALFLMGAALPGVLRVRVTPDFPNLFRRHHPITHELERIEREWGGLATISFLLTLKEGIEPSDPRLIERLRDFSSLLAGRELVTAVVSPLDFLTAAAQNHQGTLGSLPLQEEKGTLFPDWLNLKERTLRVVARVRMMQPEKFPSLASDLYGFQKNLADLFHVRLTGWPLLFKNLEYRLLDEMGAGFLLALAAIGLQLLIALRSVRLWLLALIPNLVPLTVVFGVLGWSGHGFSSGLLLAPGIALGLLADNTIHYCFRLRRGMKATGSLATAMEETIHKAGLPMVLTALVLVVGFSALFLSVFRGNQILAAVIIAVVILGLAGDLILFPSLLLLFKGARRIF